MSTDAWVTPRQIAAELGVARNTVHEIIKRGDLPAFKYGQIVRVKRADFDAFLASHSGALP